ncbi:MAG TPA: ATP-grasp domain-containing protein [Xanthobacteraceae bacterium]
MAEIDGKALLRRHGLRVPRGALLGGGAPTAAAQWPGLLLKAQLLEGGRGKRGLVRRLDTLDELVEARQVIHRALADPEVPLLLEEAIPTAREIYVAVRFDGTRPGLELLVAPEGGQEIEEARTLLRLPADAAAPAELYPHLARLFPADLAARLARYCARLPQILRTEDLELLEINPLVLTPDGALVACDVKIVRDDSAEFRHDAQEFPLSRMLAERALTPLERKALALGFQLVEVEGDVVLVTSGAGLGMMMMDLLADHGLRAACFMDNLRGAPDETMAGRLAVARELAGRPAVRGIVFQTVVASRSLAERVNALLDWMAKEPLPKPLFVGLAAGHAATRDMSVEKALAMLGAAGIAAFIDPVAMVRAAAKALGTEGQRSAGLRP